jgi:hypothetical protein
MTQCCHNLLSPQGKRSAATTQEESLMNRLLTTVLLTFSAVAFAQSPQIKNGAATPQNKANDPKGGDSHEFTLSDLLTNARLKFKEIDPCPDPAQLAEIGREIQEARSGKKLQEGKPKAAKKKPCPVIGDDANRTASGVWKSEVPGNDLLSPEQVAISCSAPERQCSVQRVRFDADQLGISVKGPDETDYQIVSWDARSLFATHDPDYSDKCHRSVLSMSFATGDVSLSDIPTNEKGCEIFKDTNSYRLIQGNYYVDTTPHNDSPEVPN